MGIAEVIPGISGGTLALILGVYEKLIEAIHHFDYHLLLLLRKGHFAEAWLHIKGTFLMILLMGMISSIFALSSLILYFMEGYPVIFKSFISSILLSSVFIEPLRPKISGYLVVGILISFTICSFLYFLPSRDVTDLDPWYIFFSGFIAITALVVPGISGSFILLLLGSYNAILVALRDLDLAVLSLFIVGAFLGLMSIVRVIKALYERKRELLLAIFFGLIVFCVPLIWLGEESVINLNESWRLILGIFLGIALVQMISRFARD